MEENAPDGHQPVKRLNPIFTMFGAVLMIGMAVVLLIAAAWFGFFGLLGLAQAKRLIGGGMLVGAILSGVSAVWLFKKAKRLYLGTASSAPLESFESPESSESPEAPSSSRQKG